MQVIETSMEMDKLIVYLPTYKNGSNESTHKCSASWECTDKFSIIKPLWTNHNTII